MTSKKHYPDGVLPKKQLVFSSGLLSVSSSSSCLKLPVLIFYSSLLGRIAGHAHIGLEIWKIIRTQST